MRITKKQASLTALAVALAAMAPLSACSSKDKESSATKAPETSATVSPPVKLRFFISDFAQPVPGGSAMDNPTFKYLAQKTNTELDVVFLPHQQYDQQLKNKYASGDIPDIVMQWGAQGDLFDNNQLVALNEYIDKYGQNLKKAIPQAAWDAVTINGKIYAIPEASAGNITENRVLFVRKDWMDNVGITSVPKTPDELLTLLRAFRDKDPNKNGKKDEIAFSGRENLSWVENLLGMYGQNQYTAKIENGEMIPGIISTNMKQGLGFLRTMMEEKLMDSEFMSNKRNIWEQKIQQGIVGMWNHDPALAWDWQDRLNKSLPNEKPNVIVIPTPKAPGVTDAGHKRGAINKVYQVTKKAKDPAAVVKFFDWLVTQEGQEFVNFGIPGDTLTKNGSQISYDKQKDTDAKTAAWRSLVLNLVGYNEEILKAKLNNDEAFAKQKDAFQVAGSESIPDIMAGMPTIKSNAPEVQDFGSATTPLFQETAAKIIFGEKPLDYFDEYVKKYRSLGGDDIIRQATEWYNKNKK